MIGICKQTLSKKIMGNIQKAWSGEMIRNYGLEFLGRLHEEEEDMKRFRKLLFIYIYVHILTYTGMYN